VVVVDFSIEYSDPEMQFRQKLFGVLASVMKVDIRVDVALDCYHVYFNPHSYIIFEKRYLHDLYGALQHYPFNYIVDCIISNTKQAIIDFYFKEKN
jgi:hypothetical protein